MPSELVDIVVTSPPYNIGTAYRTYQDTLLELTKQISLYMQGGSATKTKTHEEIRKKVLQGMEIIAEKAKITKPDSESDLQALLHWIQRY